MTDQGHPQPPVVPYHRPSDDALTKFDLGVLAVRLFGLYLLATAVQYIVVIPNYFLFNLGGTSGSPGAVIASASLAPALYLAAGIVMLRWTPWIVRRLFPEFAAGASLSLTGRDLQSVAFSVVGVWLVARALPDLTGSLTNYFFLQSFGRTSQFREILPAAITAVIEILTGLLLFFRAKALSVLWHRLRYAGVSQPPPPR